MNYKNLLLGIALICFSLITFSQSMSVMTYNIRLDVPVDSINVWNNRKAEMVQQLKYYEPDLIGFQEVLPNQLNYLNTHLKDHAYIGVGRDDGKEKGEMMAVFYDSTKLSVLNWSTFWLSETPDSVSLGWDASYNRTCTYAKFVDKKSGKIFWLFNSHFDHKGEKARLKAAKLIVSKVKEINSEKLPVIFMGDLNCEPESRPIKVLKKQFADAAEISKKELYGPVGTYNDFLPAQEVVRKIDYIFVDGFKVKSCAHLDDKTKKNRCISDHFPVLAEIKFSKKKSSR